MTGLMVAASLWLAQVRARPSPDGLPGAPQAEKLANGLYFYAVLACFVGFLVAAGTWAIASRGGNHHYAHSGKLGVLVAGGVGLLLGAAPALINFFFQAGQNVR